MKPTYYLVIFAILLSSCSAAPSTDTIATSVVTSVAGTVAAQPTNTLVPIPTDTPTLEPTNTPTPIPLADLNLESILI